MLVHSVVPQAGQERPGERLDFFVPCQCRMQACRDIFARLGIASEIRPITVIRACPDYHALPDTRWRTVAQYAPCNDCQGWQQEWLGLFLPDTTPSDITPMARARDIDLELHVQPCGACASAQGVDKDEAHLTTFEDVEKTAEEFGRVALHLPEYHQVIVMDDTIIGDGFIKQFDDTPYGMTLARRWAVRMQASDETSEQSFEELRTEYLSDIEGEQEGTCAASM